MVIERRDIAGKRQRSLNDGWMGWVMKDWMGNEEVDGIWIRGILHEIGWGMTGMMEWGWEGRDNNWKMEWIRGMRGIKYYWFKGCIRSQMVARIRRNSAE